MIAIASIFTIYAYAIKRIDDLEEKIKEQQILIDSQTRMIIDLKTKCDCEWLQSFYDEFHDEVGAFE
jgi:hypothetical protein